MPAPSAQRAQHARQAQRALTLFMNLRVISSASGGRVAENTPTWSRGGKGRTRRHCTLKWCQE